LEAAAWVRDSVAGLVDDFETFEGEQVLVCELFLGVSDAELDAFDLLKEAFVLSDLVCGGVVEWLDLCVSARNSYIFLLPAWGHELLGGWHTVASVGDAFEVFFEA